MNSRENYKRIIFAARTKRLRELGLASYKEYLDSPYWRERREKYWADHGDEAGTVQCLFCSEAARDLHHPDYRQLGRERDDDLQPLCGQHHAEVHEYGSIQPATTRQLEILRSHGYVGEVTFGEAYAMIGELGRVA